MKSKLCEVKWGEGHQQGSKRLAKTSGRQNGDWCCIRKAVGDYMMKVLGRQYENGEGIREAVGNW
jgi:hypothetical protein